MIELYLSKVTENSKTKAEIAAAKGGSSTGSETAGGDPQNPGDGDGFDQD